jgi:hypothetical protein
MEDGEMFDFSHAMEYHTAITLLGKSLYAN